jgi:hypothetical protein
LMAPQNKPMPKSASIKSPLDAGYEVALENLWQGMKKAAAQGLFSETDVERNFQQFKRVSRMLVSQGDNFLVDYFNEVDPGTLTDPVVAKKLATTISNKLGGEEAQKAMNFAPGIVEGHHGISVESTFNASKHLPWKDRIEFHRILNNEYLVGGTVAEDMYPLTKFGHQGRGTRAKAPFHVPSAHTTANPLAIAESTGFPVDTGTWGKEFDFSNIKDPRKLAAVFMEQSGYPQMDMTDRAFDSPQEAAFRKELAQRLGIRERDLYSLNRDFKTKGTEIKQLVKDAGIDVNEIAYRAYGLPVPAPRAVLPSDPNAPKAPRAKKDKVVPTFEDAERFAKGWFTSDDFNVQPVESKGLMPTTPSRVIPSRINKGLSGAGPVPTRPSPGQIAASIATREPLPTPKPAPPKQIRTEAELDRIFANLVEAPRVPPISGNAALRKPVNTTPTNRERALAAERANAGKTKAMSRSSGPPPAAQPVSQPKVGQSAILNGQAVMWNGGSWVKMPTPKAMKPTAKPRVIPAVSKPTAARTNPRQRMPASAEIRRLGNAAPDALFIYPGMGLPSNTLPGI